MLVKKLPEYKNLIMRCIASCINKDQLMVCWDFIMLFQLRFQGWIAEADYMKHIDELHSAYLNKSGTI